MDTVRRMFKRIISVGFGVIAGYLMTLGVVDVVQAWGLWPNRETARAAAQVREVMMLINKHYVDADAVTGDKLAGMAIGSMVDALDPYSGFLDTSSFRQLEEEIDSKFGGIGVQVEDIEGLITVVAPIAGTPGDRAGILRGDVIVAVDGTDARGWKLDELIGRLRGKPGTEVKVTMERGSPVREVAFSLKREIIKVDSVRDVTLREDGIGYIRVSFFAESTGAEFVAAVRKLKGEGMRALVIDLRNNPGGLLTGAVEVVEPFFTKDELVVFTDGRNPRDRQELRAKNVLPRLTLPIAVLVNGGSASAAEIVAGALRDTKRAVLIGEKTFGKGSVQTVIPVRGDAGLRITTARYYTPSGVTIHERGIEPDVSQVMTPEQEKAVFLQRLRPDVVDPVVFEARFGVQMVEDTQLAAAVRELAAQLDGAAPTRRGADGQSDGQSDANSAPASSPTAEETE